MHPVELLDGPADDVVLAAPPREYDRRKFRSMAWKTGNFLRTRGVHEGSLVAITDDATPESLLAFFGAALLDARVRFGPPAEVDARVIVGPTDRLTQFELPPGGQFVGYRDPPSDPSWGYFERDVWSENPTFPDVDHDLAAHLIETGRARYDVATVLEAADEYAATLSPDDVVAIRAPLPTPGTLVAGILAPLAADATILLPADGATGTVAVTSDAAPEPQTIDPKTVDLVPLGV